MVCQGEVIAEARYREADAISAHAEFSAVMQASRELERWRLPDGTVYVTLEPCIMCAGLMHQDRAMRVRRARREGRRIGLAVFDTRRCAAQPYI